MARLKCGDCNRLMQPAKMRFGDSIYRLEIFGQVISGQTFDHVLQCPGCGLVAYVVANTFPDRKPEKDPGHGAPA